MSYTVGNWTVSEQTTDTITTAKSLAIVDLDYVNDFTVTSRGATEVRLANTTSNGLAAQEQIRYGRSAIADVYRDAGIPDAAKCNVKAGERMLYEVRYNLKAVNSVSGAEFLLPMRGWIVLEAPTVDFITAGALETLHKRVISASYGTGETTGSLVTDVARGDLDPTL